VSKFPRIINVGNIKISAPQQQNGPSGPSTITAECTATAFVLIEPQPAPAAAATPAAAAKTE
jgi:Tfp pilus assembly protein PilO